MSEMPTPVELLQHLIQFDTTNPPGNEAACIQYIRELLLTAGIESQTFEKIEGRPNLVARLKGSGQAAPLLLYGHVDVVTTENQDWRHDPFSGEIADGYIWGRGVLDMKGGIAMLVSAFIRAKQNDLDLPGDVILCILSDEEAGGDNGAMFMADEHPELFENVRYALGEFGGFTLYMGDKRFYPIMIAEKQICWLKATFRGDAGHGSMPIRGGALAKLGNFLTTLDKKRLPVHITPGVKASVEAIAGELSGATALILKQLLNPMLTDTILDVVGERLRVFDPLLHNTVSPSILYGSNKVNVIPAEVSVELDGRLLPGYSPDDLIRELHQIAGQDVSIELIRHDPYPAEPDLSMYNLLSDTLKKADPEGYPVPLVLPGVTDGRHFSRLGIQTYGFLPMKLPPEFNFSASIHAANERIPVETMEFGTQAIYSVLEKFQ